MSEFSSGGFERRPPVYVDNQRVAEYSDEVVWTDEVIKTRIAEYQQFLETDLMPRARQEATRILMHLRFEQMYRAGAFEEQSEITTENLGGLYDGTAA